MNETIFLKLGGSLITDKNRPHTALIEQIDAIAAQLKQFVTEFPQTQLLLGHGSGSFGHVAASRYGTRNGVSSAADWQGFVEVWAEARALNEILLERFMHAGLAVMSFPLSASGVTSNGTIQNWNCEPIQSALQHNIIPIIYGDVVFDLEKGGTILSTEEQMAHLVSSLQPQRILLAGLEKGVWSDYPVCSDLLSDITPGAYPRIQKKIFGSASLDVTGGMSSKVSSMLQLVSQNPFLQVRIFSGKEDNAVYKALTGDSIGTVLLAD